MIETKVCIVGAGPGGVATALKLSYMDIPCVLIDKATFPRDKVCGDAISGKVTTLLNRLDPDILQRFAAQPTHTDVWGITFVVPNGRALNIPFQPNYVRDQKNAPGYICKRMDFDNFLIEEVKRRDNIEFYEGVEVDQYTQSDDGWTIESADGSLKVKGEILVVANGAHSAFTRKIAGIEKDNAHYAGAVRAYFKGVKDLKKDNFIELHFLKELTPGYFWVFPLPDGNANVGLGMRSDFINKRSVNLKKSFFEIVNSHPEFSKRFENAEMIGKLEGYGLPLGSKSRHISGDRFMLVGDAGHLVDPLTGEGIGHAFYSGFIAAEQARDCFAKNDYSEAFMKEYDIRVARVLGSEMKLSYRLQTLMRIVPVVNFLGTIVAGNQKFLDILSKMYNDFDLRGQLVKPFFWIKMLFSKGKS
jgi:geranylgeranyl reductase family protein